MVATTKQQVSSCNAEEEVNLLSAKKLSHGSIKENRQRTGTEHGTRKKSSSSSKRSSLRKSSAPSTASAPLPPPYSLSQEALDSWKKANGISSSTKVYQLTGCYPAIRDALNTRGWVRNLDPESSCWDLKWTVKTFQITGPGKHVAPFQTVNHFKKNQAITTKGGLMKSLRNLQWFEEENHLCFFPRCYDLSDQEDKKAFAIDFKQQEAENLLKWTVLQWKELIESTRVEENVTINISEKAVRTALKVCQRRINEISDTDLDAGRLCLDYAITEEEWNSLLLKDECRQEETLALDNNIFVEIQNTLEAMRQKLPQFELNGSVGENVWICKPAGKSRGRGIRVFNNLNDLLKYVGGECCDQWVCQKYIENPLTICRRKFDIRQWVLVTSWNPLIVWFNTDCYLRFCAEEYGLEDLKNPYVHLANNCVQKRGVNFHQTYSTEGGEEQISVEGNMWHSEQLIQYFKQTKGSADIWYQKMQPRMKEIVISSLKCAQDQIEHRANSFELFGYDFMFDENYNPWLIEVNSSPACDYSTSVTERIVKEGLCGVLSVVLDYGSWEAQMKKSSRVTDNNAESSQAPSTGNWVKIHSGSHVPLPISSLGAVLEVAGSRMKYPSFPTSSKTKASSLTTKANRAVVRTSKTSREAPTPTLKRNGADGVKAFQSVSSASTLTKSCRPSAQPASASKAFSALSLNKRANYQAVHTSLPAAQGSATMKKDATSVAAALSDEKIEDIRAPKLSSSRVRAA